MHAITISVSCSETNSREGLHYLTVVVRRAPTMPTSLTVRGPKHNPSVIGKDML